MRDCEICCGERRIRLPLYKSVSVMDSEQLTVDVGYRTFPCPECSAGDNIPVQRLAVIKSARAFPGHWASDERFLERARGGMVHALVDDMLQRGLFRFEQDAPDSAGRFRIRLTVAIAALADVAKLEERVAERQFEVADALVVQTREEIANWGSYYTGREHGSVEKSQAVEWLVTALKKVKAKYGKQ